MSPFGELLESMRRRRGLTQSQLADLVKIKPCYISAIERGKKGPPSQTIINNITFKLKLSSSELEALKQAKRKTKFTRKVPQGVSVEEFDVIDQLWDKLGSLTSDQIKIITLTLNMNNQQRR